MRRDLPPSTMFSKVLLCCLFAYVAAGVVEEYPPQPYSFAYDNTDEFGTRIAHEESADANNARVGSYTYSDASGIARTVKYTADATGFHATVETNEPGTKSSAPADVQYASSAVEGPAPVAVKAAPVVVKTVHAAPVVHAVHAVHAAPVAFHAAPVSFAVAHAPLTYTLAKRA
ncbi:cuticle protein 10.9-like [Ixodes scapularis]